MSLSVLSSTASVETVAPPQKTVATPSAAPAAPAAKADAVTISPAGHAASSADADHDGH